MLQVVRNRNGTRPHSTARQHELRRVVSTVNRASYADCELR